MLLTSTLLAATIGLGSFGFLSNTKTSEIEEIAASRETPFTGVYKKVTSMDELSGEESIQVLLRSDYGDVLRDCGGNPGYLYSTRDNLYISHNGEIVYAKNAYVVELTVVPGTADNSIALGGSYRMGWGNHGEKYGYISFDGRGSGPSHPGSIDYTDIDIGFWKDGTGVRKNVLDDLLKEHRYMQQ